MNTNNLFYCYSGKLKSFLCEKGLKFLHKGFNDKTQRQFWVFHRDEELNSYLTEWSSKK